MNFLQNVNSLLNDNQLSLITYEKIQSFKISFHSFNDLLVFSGILLIIVFNALSIITVFKKGSH